MARLIHPVVPGLLVLDQPLSHARAAGAPAPGGTAGDAPPPGLTSPTSLSTRRCFDTWGWKWEVVHDRSDRLLAGEQRVQHLATVRFGNCVEDIRRRGRPGHRNNIFPYRHMSSHPGRAWPEQPGTAPLPLVFGHPGCRVTTAPREPSTPRPVGEKSSLSGDEVFSGQWHPGWKQCRWDGTMEERTEGWLVFAGGWIRGQLHALREAWHKTDNCLAPGVQRGQCAHRRATAPPI